MSRTMTVFVGSAMVVSLASLASLTASCSRTSSDDLSEAGPDSKANAPFDAGDANAMEDATPPDGGPPPVVACDGGACALPPSVCLDEVWLRAYTTASCDVDAGRCTFETVDRKCDQFDPGPYCYQGGCRVILVR